jgi:hypothetical protein
MEKIIMEVTEEQAKFIKASAIDTIKKTDRARSNAISMGMNGKAFSDVITLLEDLITQVDYKTGKE